MLEEEQTEAEPYIIKERIEEYKSLDEDKESFEKYVDSPPTLEEALKALGVPEPKTAAKDAKEKSKEAKESLDIKFVPLTDDEAGAIACYTFNKIKVRGILLYKVVNTGIVTERKKDILKNYRKFIYLFLCGLRKLQKYELNSKTIYRGIDIRVPKSKTDANGHQWYEKGRTVTWWGFTSTSLSPKVAKDFMEGSSKGTLFTISGGNSWGYDVHAFSDYPEEKEILLEPEAKVKVTKVKDAQGVLKVKAELQPFGSLVLEDVIKMSSIVKLSRSRKPERLRTKNDIYKEVEFSWSPVDGEDVTYQVTVKEYGNSFFSWFSNSSITKEVNEPTCTIPSLEVGKTSLEVGKTYEFKVRCKTNRDKEWGEWAGPIYRTIDDLDTRMAIKTLKKYKGDQKVCLGVLKGIAPLLKDCK